MASPQYGRNAAPCAFSKNCKELLHAHMYNWTFARITSIKEKSNAYYYGFAEEVDSLHVAEGKTIWFKLGKEVPAIVLGPLSFSCNQDAPPRCGSIIVGRTGRKRSGLERFDWWYRDGAPLFHLYTVVCDAWDRDLSILCKNTRYLPDLSLDNLWAFIRLIENEDIQSFVAQYLPGTQQQLHPLRKHSGKRGYVLDRSTYQFIIDTSIFFGCPTIYKTFERRMQQQKLCLDLTPHLAQEKMDFQDGLDIHNSTKECYMT